MRTLEAVLFLGVLFVGYLGYKAGRAKWSNWFKKD